jgi:hypothetical protein
MVTVGVCTIGVHLYGAIPLGIYDIGLTIVLTTMFVIPIVRSSGNGHETRLWSGKLVTKLKNRFISTAIPPIPMVKTVPGSQVTVPPSQLQLASLPDVVPVASRSTTCSRERPSSSVHFDFEVVHSRELRKLAVKSLLGSSAGLLASGVNLFVMISKRGQEEGSSCMRFCLVDVVVNALAVYAVMQGREPWWKMDDARGRPTESLPRGIWDDTEPEHGSTHVTTRISKASSSRRSTTGRTGRTGLGFLADGRVISTGKKRLSSIAALGRRDEHSSFSATSSRQSRSRSVQLQLDVDRSRSILVKTPLPELLSDIVGKGKGREDGWTSDGSTSTLQRHSRTYDIEPWSPENSIPLVLPPLIQIPNGRKSDPTFPEDVIPTYELPNEPRPARIRHSLQLGVLGDRARRRWSNVDNPTSLPRNNSYT